MPVRDGPATAEWIREYERTRRKRAVPIIGLTGFEDETTRKRCLEAGMDTVLCKPIKKHDVLALLRELAGGR